MIQCSNQPVATICTKAKNTRDMGVRYAGDYGKDLRHLGFPPILTELGDSTFSYAGLRYSTDAAIIAKSCRAAWRERAIAGRPVAGLAIALPDLQRMRPGF